MLKKNRLLKLTTASLHPCVRRFGPIARKQTTNCGVQYLKRAYVPEAVRSVSVQLRIQFGELKPHAYDVGWLAFGPVAVRRRDESAVGQNLDSWIAAIRAFSIVHDANSILPLATFQQILIRADPTDPVALGRADVGRVSKADEEPAVWSVLGRVAIAGQRCRQFARLGPT